MARRAAPTKVAKKTVLEEQPKEEVKAPETVKVVKTARSPKKKVAAPTVAPPKPGCTLYIGRLPHGFNEEELHGYFSQFGQISRLRVSRNKQSGAPKHYGFIEFFHQEVAKIVAETMNNYLLFGHLLQCRVMPESELHAELFKGAGKKFAKIPWAKIAAKKFNARKEGQSEEEARKEAEAAQARIDECREKCKAMGIDYDFDSIVKTKISA